MLGFGASAESSLRKGNESFAAGRYEEAADHFRSALQQRPDSAEAQNNLGLALFSLGRMDEAARALESALAIKAGGARIYFLLGTARFHAGQHAGAVEALREAVRLAPDLGDAHCNLGLALQEVGKPAEALASLRRALELDPANADYATNLRVVEGRASVPMWHFSMMNDAERNGAYAQGLANVVRPGDHVLEIGTGGGLLALLAARAGARRVTTCEEVPALAAKAREIVAANDESERIRVLHRKSTALTIPADMPGKADVLVAEIIASDLIGEGLLESFEDALRRLVVEGARVIPSRAWVLGQLAAADGLDRHVRVGRVEGFDLGAFNAFSPIKMHAGEVGVDFTALSEAFEVFEFDLANTRYFAPERREMSATATREGRCMGILQWIRLELAPGVRFENHPARGLRRAGHWQQVLHLFKEPVDMKPGDRLSFVAAHNRHNLLFYVQ